MKSAGSEQLDKSMRLIRLLGRSPRSREATRASARYWGKQYDHLKDWTEEAPLRDKKPPVNVRLTKVAIDTVNDRLFGEARRPTFSVQALEEFDDLGDDQLDEDGNPIDEDALEALANASNELATLIRESKLAMHFEEIGRIGMLHGTVALAFHQLESGRTWCEVIVVGDTQATFARDDRRRAESLGLDESDLLNLEEYWRTAEEDPATGEVVVKIHRRTWSTDRTVEYLPIVEDEVDAAEDYQWIEDEERTVVHDLGFVPVVWIPNRRIANDDYGAPLLEDAEYSIEDEFNYTLSQTGRGIRYNQEPTPVFTDVSNFKHGESLKTGGNNSIVLESMGPGSNQATATLLEMTGAGQAAAFQYLDRLRDLFYEVASVVVHDPAKFGGVMSGVALKMLLLPLIAKVGQLRESYGAGLRRYLELAMRARGEGYRVRVDVTWPEVVDLMPNDIQAILAPLERAYLNGFVTLRTVVETVAPIYGITDVDRYLAELATEAGRATPEDITTEEGSRAVFGEEAVRRAQQNLTT